MKQKLKVRILKLEGCGGCIQRLATTPSLLEIMKHFDIIDSNISNEKTDYLFVEGFAVNLDQQRILKEAIENTKNTVLFGSCSIQPNVMIALPDTNKASQITKIKAKLVGCPPSYDEINELISHLLIGKTLRTTNTPVCDDCIKNEIKCLLLKGVNCLGPCTKGNCGILCMKIGKSCSSCRTKIEEENDPD